MSVEEYSLKFSMLYRYAPSLVSDSRDEISHFLAGVVDLEREEYRTAMLHDDMTLARLMAFAQSIKESKLRRMDRNLKRSCSVIRGNVGSKRGLKLNKKLRVLW